MNAADLMNQFVLSTFIKKPWKQHQKLLITKLLEISAITCTHQPSEDHLKSSFSLENTCRGDSFCQKLFAKACLPQSQQKVDLTKSWFPLKKGEYYTHDCPVSVISQTTSKIFSVPQIMEPSSRYPRGRLPLPLGFGS